jgi:hypothetical protein
MKRLAAPTKKVTKPKLYTYDKYEYLESFSKKFSSVLFACFFGIVVYYSS